MVEDAVLGDLAERRPGVVAVVLLGAPDERLGEILVDGVARLVDLLRIIDIVVLVCNDDLSAAGRDVLLAQPLRRRRSGIPLDKIFEVVG
jgi:hypothetical protein